MLQSDRTYVGKRLRHIREKSKPFSDLIEDDNDRDDAILDGKSYFREGDVVNEEVGVECKDG